MTLEKLQYEIKNWRGPVHSYEFLFLSVYVYRYITKFLIQFYPIQVKNSKLFIDFSLLKQMKNI